MRKFSDILQQCLLLIAVMMGFQAAAQCDLSAGFTYAPYTGSQPSETGVTFYNTSTGDYTNLSWQYGNEAFSGDTLDIFFPDFGVYEVTLTVWDDSCSNSITQQVVVGDVDICTITDCVWPGDADKNGVANFYDILQVSLAYGTNGPARELASTNWEAQPAADWTQSTPDGINYKHFDCDGNGTINEFDIAVISQVNYSPLTNNNIQQEIDNPVLYIVPKPGFDSTIITATDQVYTVEADLFLGTVNVPATQLYGLAFHLDIPADLSEFVTNINFVYDSDFFGDPLNVLYAHQRQNEQTDLALSRTNSSNTNGFGKLGTLKFDVIGDIIDGRTEPTVTMPIYTQGIEAIKANGTDRPISNSNEIPAFTFVNMVTGTGGPNAPWLTVQPNPAADYINIGITADLRASRCIITNAIGQEVINIAATEGSNNLDTHSLPNGIYTLRVITERGVVSRQVVIAR